MGRPKELSEKERKELLAKGYRPVEIWVPDWDSPEILERIRRECEAINEADRRSGELEYIDELVADLWDELPG